MHILKNKMKNIISYKYLTWLCATACIIYLIIIFLQEQSLKTSKIEDERKDKYISLWIIFYKIKRNNLLKEQLEYLVKNILDLTSRPLHFNFLVDQESEPVVKNIFDDELKNRSMDVIQTFFDIRNYENVITEIYKSLMDYFSKKRKKIIIIE